MKTLLEPVNTLERRRERAARDCQSDVHPRAPQGGPMSSTVTEPRAHEHAE
jgi:hypothetical protein